MADYHLYIHMGEAENDSAMAGGAENAKESSKEDATAKGIARAAKKIVSYAAIRSTADQLVSGYIGQVELSTGATEYEQRLQTNYNLGKQIWDAGASLVMGAAVGGPVGFAVALTGVVMNGVHQLISYGQRKTELQKQETVENLSISALNIRAGTAGRRGRDQ